MEFLTKVKTGWTKFDWPNQLWMIRDLIADQCSAANAARKKAD